MPRSTKRRLQSFTNAFVKRDTKTYFHYARQCQLLANAIKSQQQ